MSDIIIGTAGHIDHGKTALVKALTGIDTDRLAEEKRRGISIELGFAHLTLPSGIIAAFVDVPGHERFIKNMLAGAAGLDMALLIVAADEGVMPQTKEHLAILSLLDIKKLIAVITKIDLVENDYLGLVREDLVLLLTDTGYQDAAIREVSVRSGQGLSELTELLDREGRAAVNTRPTDAPARLPIDRVFVMPGFGTVVTGTLFDGKISLGDNLEIVIKQKRVRVRNLQVHNRAVASVVAGQRAALNLAGLETKDIEKGDVLSAPGWHMATTRIDVFCRILKNAPWTLKPYTRIRFYQGTKEALGRVKLLDRAEILPGEEAYMQIAFEEPILVRRGDNYIIRSYSPAVTLGGGKVVEPHARQHKKKEANFLGELEIKAFGDIESISELYIEKNTGLTGVTELAKYLGKSEAGVEDLLRVLVAADRVSEISVAKERCYLGKKKTAQWAQLISREIKSHKQKFPLEIGLDKELLRAKYWPEMALKEYNALLQYWIEQGIIEVQESRFLALAGQKHTLDADWTAKIKAVEQYFLERQWQIPGWGKIKGDLGLDNETGNQVLQYLVRSQQLFLLAEDLYIWDSRLKEAQRKIKVWFEANDELTVAQARDLLGTSRKIAVPLLEYLDKMRFTVRDGEARRLAAR